MNMGTKALPVLLIGLGLVVTACPTLQDRPADVEYAADPEQGEVAIEFAGPGGAALVVPVFVNGEGPYDFVLDTGATLTCIDQRIAEDLGLPERRGGGIGAGATEAGRVRIVRIDSLRVGQSLATEIDGCVLDLAHTEAIGVEIDGLLGLNFLRAFRITLDFERNVVVFEKP
jgi:predicted aspartyl protease